MIAYKFLRAGAIDPFNGSVWPSPGTARVEACRAEDLPLWIAEELWRVELADPVEEAQDKLVAGGARLLERIEGWNARTRADYAAWCVDRARETASAPGDEFAAGYLADAEEAVVHAGEPGVRGATATAVVGYFARIAAAHERARREGLPPRAAQTMEAVAPVIAAERARQAQWLAARLGL